MYWDYTHVARELIKTLTFINRGKVIFIIYVYVLGPVAIYLINWPK